MAESNASLPCRRVAVVVRGVVQGVGFRPFVYNAALSRGLSGWVLNEADRVRIEAQGTAGDVAAFLELMQNHPPRQANIESLEVSDIPCRDGEPIAFEICKSDKGASPRPTIPADLATCAECLAEIFNSSERRYGYPFTNCTNCGPRWSIIEELPYDRPRTSMKYFAMCDDCRAEYENPSDRRFHAQPIACPKCGPHLLLFDAHSSREFAHAASRDILAHVKADGNDDRIIRQSAEAILSGKILALKGLGGFQLLADATNAASVALLRERKRRPDRPFALMMQSLEEVRRYCQVTESEADMLASHHAPIVLLRQNAPAPRPSSLAPSIAPGNPYLGVMLPYTPLHHLLLAAVGQPVVCTSGNISEEPMAISIEESLERLGNVADLFLTHDRSIVRPVDDSIVRFGPAGMQVFRRARGFAPLPIEVRNESGRTILAVGGHLKNTVALCLSSTLDRANQDVLAPDEIETRKRGLSGSPVIISAHIGDLDSAASVKVFQRAIEDMLRFYQTAPEMIVCDLHPDYASTRYAESLAAHWQVPLLRVQHHHAHVAACMAEHHLTCPVLGFSWDGTGYGGDGTIWGGEALVCPGNAPLPGCCVTNQEHRVPGGEFIRFAHLRTFSLPGGDTAARKPRRSAIGVLYEIFGEAAADYAKGWFPPGEVKTLMQMLSRGTNCPRTSSLGRLFDAVSAIVELTPSSGAITFEGQAAMALEFAAEVKTSPLPQGERPGVRAYQLSLRLENNIFIADWEPMIRQIITDFSKGVSAAEISLYFHHALAEMAVDIAKTANLQQVVLSGGCFQNSLLLRLTYSRLTEAGFQVFLPQLVPPGDGGIALGQIFIAGLKTPIE